jgi:hypothetical protein
MKRLIFTILILTGGIAGGQENSFTIISLPVKLRILNDTTRPSITILPVRNIEPGYKLVQADTVIGMSGTIADAGGLAYLMVDTQKVPVIPGGKFSFRVRLHPGRNTFRLRAVDRKNNISDTTLVVYQKSGADTTAPTITILQPFLGRGIKAVRRMEMQHVIGTIEDDTPIASITVNGRPVDSLVQGGTFFAHVPTEKLRAIYVRAVDTTGNFSVDSLSLPAYYYNSPEDVASLPTGGKFHALLMGVSRYKSSQLPELANPISDAQTLQKILTEQYLFAKEDVTLLKDPTRTKIMQQFVELSKRVKEEDNLLIFYAGHGKFDTDADQGYWLPNDAEPDNSSNNISNSDIRDNIKRIRARHILLISDACFSGSVFQQTRAMLDGADIPTEEAYSRTSRTALTSGRDAVPDKSIFTKYLIRNLEDSQMKFLRASHLFFYLHDDVMTNSPNHQKVEYGVIQQADDTGGGDFVFIRRNSKSPKAEN